MCLSGVTKYLSEAEECHRESIGLLHYNETVIYYIHHVVFWVSHINLSIELWYYYFCDVNLPIFQQLNYTLLK